jgi:hypothetical protein
MPPNVCGHPTPDGGLCKNAPKRGEQYCAAHLGLVGRKPMLGSDAGDEVQAKLVAFLRGGNYVSTACAAVGISETAYYAWLEHGEADRANDVASPYADFAEACVRARAEGQAVLVQEVRRAGRDGDWKASAWMLERSYPEQFGVRREVKHSGGIAARTAAPEVPEDVDRLLTVAQLVDDIGALPATGGGLGGNGHSNGGVGGNGHGAA